MNRIKLQANSEAATMRIGSLLGGLLRPGDVVALNGELGAGKTQLTRAIVHALDGEDAAVNSPTFVIVQRYDVRLPVYHIDAYRLTDAEEFLALGGDEILGGEGVCLIEWASRIEEVLPPDHLRIEITASSPQSRSFFFTASGARSGELLASLRQLDLVQFNQ